MARARKTCRDVIEKWGDTCLPFTLFVSNCLWELKWEHNIIYKIVYSNINGLDSLVSG